MADLPSILGGMAQGFLDFGKSAVDLFGTGGASIADLIESARTGKVTTRNSDDFRKWLYDTNDVKDAAAKGLGTALNGVQTVSDYIPGIGAVTRNPLFNAGQGALGGLADEFKMYGKDYDLGRAGQRAAVGAGGALASTGLADALKGSGNALLKSGTAQGLARGAVGGAIGAGGYTAIDGGSLGDVANSALQGAGMGAALGGTMGALQDFKPAKTYDVALTDEEKAARIKNAQDMLVNEQNPERIAELHEQIKKYGGATAQPDYLGDEKYSKLVKKAKGYKSLDRFEKMNNPIKGSEIWGEKPKSYFERDSRAVRINMFPNDATKGTGLTKQYLLNMFKDAYDDGITDIVPSYGSYTKEGASFMNHLADQGWVKKNGINGYNSYEIAPKIAEWEKTNPLADIYNAANSTAPKALETTLADADMAVNNPKLTPEQEAYFKDSVIRDENGNLIPMYHGTRGNFTVFGDNAPSGTSNSHAGVGNWFTPTKEGAKNFAESIWYGDGEPTVMETYLNVKNPKIYESVDNSEAVAKLRKELDSLRFEPKNLSDTHFYHRNIYDSNQAMRMVETGDVDMALKWLTDKGYDSDKAAEYIDELVNLNKLNSRRKSLQDSISDLKYGDAYERFRTDLYKVGGQTAEDANLGGIGMALNDRDTIQKYVDGLKSEGYDGILIKGTRYDADTMGGPNDQYVVFDSNQIKDINNLKPTDAPSIMESRMAPEELDLARALANQDLSVNNGVSIYTNSMAPETRRALDIITQRDVPVENELYNRIDPKTLPQGYEKLRNLVDSRTSIDEQVQKKLGKNPLKADVDELLDYLYPNEPLEKRVFHKSLNESIEKYKKDAAALGVDASKAAEDMTRTKKLELIKKIYDDVKFDTIEDIGKGIDVGDDLLYATQAYDRRGIRTGYPGALDTALSERLDIAPGNTIKITDSQYDWTGDDFKRKNLGRYTRNAKDISVREGISGIEGDISTMAHERLHSFQNEARPENAGRYSKEVTDAYNELSKDLKPYIKDDDSIAKIYGASDTNYYASPIEQESRMLQTYLDNKGYTKDALYWRNKQNGGNPEWGNEINPAFDKFFDKLRDLSKRGVALPALTALFGGGALMANQQKDKEEVR